MTGNCNTRPDGILRYYPPGLGQIRFLIERNDKTNESGNLIESWDFEYAELSAGFDREQIINDVIRARYSQSQVEAIFANYLSGTDTGEYASFQRWRNVAKAVADGKYLKSEISYLLIAEVGDVVESIVTVLNDKGMIP